jgi:hypothetical protein
MKFNQGLSRSCHLARSYWMVTVQSDRRSKPLDLIRIGWPRSHLTLSVSDLLSPVRSRSYGRKRKGEELTGKMQRRGPAVLELQRRGPSSSPRCRQSVRRHSAWAGEGDGVLGDLESFLQTRGEAARVRRPHRWALGMKKIGQEEGIWEAALLPGGSGRRGASGGEAY